MASVGQFFTRTFFWTYERGTWQYDVAVVLILIFVFLPRPWFHEQSQVGINPEPGEVRQLSSGTDSDVYRVDARLLAPPVQTPALENGLHNALTKTLPELRNRHFSIARIEAVRDASGTVIAYDVEVHH
ncbi:MAG TPA: hypothetical protein VE545_07055 [Candidatus Dormibacteraeota bacterium]|nr:hypothetical protein [Candidatus Dormibacteraeota bacterium]